MIFLNTLSCNILCINQRFSATFIFLTILDVPDTIPRGFLKGALGVMHTIEKL